MSGGRGHARAARAWCGRERAGERRHYTVASSGTIWDGRGHKRAGQVWCGRERAEERRHYPVTSIIKDGRYHTRATGEVAHQENYTNFSFVFAGFSFYCLLFFTFLVLWLYTQRFIHTLNNESGCIPRATR